MNKQIYLDYAAATPLNKQVLAKMLPYFSDSFYNPSATYLPAVKVRHDVENARARVAHWFGARPSEIVFTAGGTEANNLAIRGVMSQFADGNLVVSALEHDSVLETARQYSYKEAPVSNQGIVDVEQLAKLIDDKTVLVSVMYANNEVGTIQPIRRIAHEIDKIRKQRRTLGNKRPLYLHTDAAQAGAYLDLHASRLGADLITVNGGKIYGPKGSGALYVAHAVGLTAQLSGGGQERGLRSGTENVANIIGLAEALDMAQNQRAEESERLAKLQKIFWQLLKEILPQAVINGSTKMRLPNNLHITIPGQDNERLILELEQKGVMAAAGSACSASKEEPSHVLKVMGATDNEARSSLRLSMGRQTTEDDIRQTVKCLKEIV